MRVERAKLKVKSARDGPRPLHLHEQSAPLASEAAELLSWRQPPDYFTHSRRYRYVPRLLKR